MGVVQLHMDPPPIPLIKIKHDDKSDKYFIKLKLRRYLTSDKLDLYEFKIDFSTMVSWKSFCRLFATST